MLCPNAMLAEANATAPTTTVAAITGRAVGAIVGVAVGGTAVVAVGIAVAVVATGAGTAAVVAPKPKSLV